ncbi:CHC2 zinc finger domain-containing protein, partial [Staphylococcus epidermidis]|uniref:CHC2 zinc finger domain-containing protein n=1 Tax=Staphylococcus epidermidis TaxID=1282 RepID=UPI0021B18AC9
MHQSLIHQIKNKTHILHLLTQYLKLEKRQPNYIRLCPFHDQKTPSFTLSQHKQISHSFPSKKPRNLFQFTQQIKHVSFLQP